MPKSTMGFSPKRSPRPVYPSAASVFQNFLLHTFRPTLISTVLTYVIAPYYFSAVEYLEAAGHSDRAIYTLLTSLVHTVCYISINLFFFEIGCDILGWFDKVCSGLHLVAPTNYPSSIIHVHCTLARQHFAFTFAVF